MTDSEHSDIWRTSRRSGSVFMGEEPSQSSETKSTAALHSGPLLIRRHPPKWIRLQNGLRRAKHLLSVQDESPSL